MTLALSTPDSWLLGIVIVATLLAIGHLANRWSTHTRGKQAPVKPKSRPKPKARPASSIPSDQPAPVAPGTSLDERRAWASERVVHWWVVANRAHNASIADAPTVQFSPRLKHALGWADSRRNLIKISDWHLMDKPIEVADDTVAHEVAHIFADRHYGKPCRHGKLWKKTMVAMGRKPDVTYRDTPEEVPEEEAASAA
jgi:hypothetical protein